MMMMMMMMMMIVGQGVASLCGHWYQEIDIGLELTNVSAKTCRRWMIGVLVCRAAPP
jgi:hypothetical protein